MSIKSILCVYLATVATVSTLAVNKLVKNNQNNRLDTPDIENQQEEPTDAPIASYEYAYDVNDPLSNDVKSHREIRDGENVYGFYTFKEADGSTRVVNYKVGPTTGFEATVERLELGDDPDIRSDALSTPPPQEVQVQENVRVEQRRRPRGRGRARTGFAGRNPYVDPPRHSRPHGNNFGQATAPELEFYTYVQDEKPLRGGKPEDVFVHPPRNGAEEVPVPNLQTNQDWKNSVIGRKHIRKQIAILAKKKKEEEELKAAKAQQQQQEEAPPPLPTTEEPKREEPTHEEPAREEPPEEREEEEEEEKRDEDEDHEHEHEHDHDHDDEDDEDDDDD